MEAILHMTRAFVIHTPLFLPLLVVVGVILDCRTGWGCVIAGIVLKFSTFT